MSELTEQDAMRIAMEYYTKRFTLEDTIRLTRFFIKCDIVGLIQYAYSQGVNDTKGELNK